MTRHLLLLVMFFFGCKTHAQHQDKVDFINGTAMTVLNPKEKSIDGKIAYSYNILKQVDSIFLDAINMEFSEVTINEKKVDYSYDGKKIAIFSKFEKGQSDTLSLTYKVTPKQTVYFSGWNDEIEGNEQVWTQGQGKYTSHWLPSFDDMEEKVEFDLYFMVDGENDYTILSNGILKEKGDFMGTSIWLYDMSQPMSSYLVSFAIGNYKKRELKSKSGISIENYYYPQDSLKVEPTYRYTKEIFDFLEEEIGVPYPWQNYKQIPVRDFLYAGMENTTATIFSDGYVIDSTAFVDKNYVNVNAHELAHQWFGNLVTEKNGNHHWLHEGFATYYAYLAEQELFGDDHFYWKLFNSAKVLQKLSDTDEGQALTDPKASSATFYEKGAWALVILKDKIGDKAFKKGIKSYLKKHQFKNVTVHDFLNEMEVAAKVSLADFESKWLQSTVFQSEEIKDYLMTKSSSIRMFYVSKELYRSSHMGLLHKQIKHIELGWLKEDEPIEYKLALLDEFKGELDCLGMINVLNYPNIKIRQKAISLLDATSEDFRTIDEFNSYGKQVCESLLLDKSYVTIENALFMLWSTYPEEKAKYLEQTKDVIGLPNKNVRLLWLTLAIVTNDYNARKTQDYFLELSGYTSERYGSEVRMGAFQYLHQAVGLNNASLKSLIKATTHHSWQFKKFARNLVDELLKDADYEVRLQEIAKELNEEEVRYINTKLDRK